MLDYRDWWLRLPKKQKGLYLIACYAFILYGSIDVGRALYQVTH